MTLGLGFAFHIHAIATGIASGHVELGPTSTDEVAASDRVVVQGHFAVEVDSVEHHLKGGRLGRFALPRDFLHFNRALHEPEAEQDVADHFVRACRSTEDPELNGSA